jgi:hypothetical protein
MTQVVDCLPSKHQELSSNTSMAKNDFKKGLAGKDDKLGQNNFFVGN